MKLTGIVMVKIDGVLMRSEPGAELSMGGFRRPPHTGHKVYGHHEEVVHAEVKFTTFHAGGDDLRGLGDKVDATLEFETDTGDTYVVREAWCAEPPVLTGGEGKVAWVFYGQPAELM